MTNVSRTIASVVFAEDGRDDHPAVAMLDGGAISYGRLHHLVEQLAASLDAIGIVSGDRIAVVFPRGPSGIIAFLAASSVACCCPLHPGMRADEFEAYFSMLGVTGLLDGTASAAAAEAAARLGVPLVGFAWTGGDVEVETKPSTPRRTGDATAADPLHDTALLMQTSGTTSKPKLVALTHANIIAAATGIVDWFGLGPADVCLNPMPLHHLHGLITASLASLIAGSAVCCVDSFSPDRFHEALASLQPTWFTASPTMHLALRAFYGRGTPKIPTQRLRFFRSSSAPLPASVITELEALFAAPLMETYGLTETSSMICANPLPPGVRKPGSVGVAVGAEIRVVDDNGHTLPPGQNGEVVIRGPSVIACYLGSPDVSDPYFYGDWLRTGDIGVFDADAYLSIVGRTKELIKRGGLSVYPDEIDNALLSHPGVAEAVTFSVSHATLGEELVSAIVPKKTDVPSEQALKDHLASQLSSYKVPAAILVVDHLPKTETGKVVRREVPTHFAAALTPRNEPPATDLEATVLGLWRDCLDRRDFGVGDNLLLLGADPIRAATVAATLRAQFGRSLPAKEMIAQPTVRAIAARLDAVGGAP